MTPWKRLEELINSSQNFGGNTIATLGYGGPVNSNIQKSTYSLLYLKTTTTFFDELHLFCLKNCNVNISADRSYQLLEYVKSEIPILLDFYRLHKIRCTRNRIAHQPFFFIEQEIFCKDYNFLQTQIKEISLY